MTREEAMSYDNELKDKLMLAAKRMGLAENIGSDIVDGCIMVIPDDNRKGMIFLGKESASYKVGNIRMDLKKAIVAGLELVASAIILTIKPYVLINSSSSQNMTYILVLVKILQNHVP